MKSCVIFLTLLLVGCSDRSSSGFEIHGYITGDLPDYIYMNYGNIQDSAKITDNTFLFKGNVDGVLEANIFIPPISTIDSMIYIENSKMLLEFEIDKKQINQKEVFFIKVEKIEGAKTQEVISDFSAFKRLYAHDKNLRQKTAAQVLSITRNYPKNPFSADVLLDHARDSTLSKEQTELALRNLSDDNTGKYAINEIKKLLNPEQRIEKGNLLKDFNLQASNGTNMSTQQLRGKCILIEFWASWCTPCRVKAPKLKDVYKNFKSKNFEIIGVSLDKDKENWKRAIEKDRLPWPNLIVEKGFDSNIAAEFGITYIPYNLLVDEKGIIIDVNIDIDKMPAILNKLTNCKE